MCSFAVVVRVISVSNVFLLLLELRESRPCGSTFDDVLARQEKTMNLERINRLTLSRQTTLSSILRETTTGARPKGGSLCLFNNIKE